MFDKRVYQPRELKAAAELWKKKTVSKIKCVTFSFDGVWKCLQIDLQLLEKMFLYKEYRVNMNPVTPALEWLQRQNDFLKKYIYVSIPYIFGIGLHKGDSDLHK